MCLCYDVIIGVPSCSIKTCREGVVNKRQKVKKASGEELQTAGLPGISSVGTQTR